VEVAEIVAALTKNMALAEKEREADYVARLAKADWRARLIKLADQYDNVSDAIASGWTGERMKKVITKAEHAIRLAVRDIETAGQEREESARAIAALGQKITVARGDH
jgi:(p)ppGpp synthase/HD superfamily hydrolase